MILKEGKITAIFRLFSWVGDIAEYQEDVGKEKIGSNGVTLIHSEYIDKEKNIRNIRPPRKILVTITETF